MTERRTITMTPERLAWLREQAPRLTGPQLVLAWEAAWGERWANTSLRQLCRRHGLRTCGEGHFRAGGIPWNKGVSKPASGGTLPNLFRPGQVPTTWVPVGTMRQDRNGYWKMKVREMPVGTGQGKKNWEFVHRLVYTSEVAPLAPGEVVLILDGDPEHCMDHGNLVAVTRAQLAWLNGQGFQGLPPDRAIRRAMVETARLVVAVQRAARAAGLDYEERRRLTAPEVA